MSDCLRCICAIESNCRPLACEDDVTGLACGYFQLHEDYYNDCKGWGDMGRGTRITMPWRQCSADMACSAACVQVSPHSPCWRIGISVCLQNYMARYASRCNPSLTCEVIARVHNGGPNGCRNSATLLYWNRVRGCLG
jgi:Destabilase